MKLLLTILFLLYTGITFAQDGSTKNYTTKKVQDLDITIDGKFDEPVWQTATWEDHFIQHEPTEGEPPYQQTEFSILYDDNNMYVAIKSLDTNPDSISLRVTKRDVTDGDLVAVLFDTYYDKRTAFGFAVSAAGVKSDFVESNDGESEDFNWDPIWWVKTSKNGLRLEC